MRLVRNIALACMALGALAAWPTRLAVPPDLMSTAAVQDVVTDARTTAAITMPADPIMARKRERLGPSDPAGLKAGLDALAARDIDRVRVLRDALPPASLDRHILEWALALRGGSSVTSSEIVAATRQLAGWPGAETFRANAERALYREQPAPELVLATFRETPPQTIQGLILLARAHLASDDTPGALAVLTPVWSLKKLDPDDEDAILKEFGALIPPAVHRQRMERMLYAERVSSARRVAELAGAKPLLDAWASVIRGEKTAGKLLDAVPKELRSTGYLFAKARWLRRGDRIEEAARTMLAAPTDAEQLGDPDAWWIERRALSRELLDEGDARMAYRVAAAHAAESPSNQVDAEFHAGWYALRSLRDPKRAAVHFARIADVAEGPISLARGYYWQGRAAEAGGPGKAQDFYRQAARFGTTFYGQLAAARLGQDTINVEAPLSSADERRSFENREAVDAIRRLQQAGYPALADVLYRDLAAQLTSPGELSLLTAMAEQRSDHYLALRIAKIAAQRGVEVGALSHPLGAIPESADISGSGMALAYAIARQESEFNVGAVSGAGARGLLQLMPGTARDVAQRSGLAYSAERLVSDAGYNATLGSAFLGEQLARFDGSYVLTFAGYNAGPKRASQWAARYGDPRGKSIDAVVDWIERIPYAETRSYVQRVMENYQVYKMRLTGHVDVERDLIRGRMSP